MNALADLLRAIVIVGLALDARTRHAIAATVAVVAVALVAASPLAWDWLRVLWMAAARPVARAGRDGKRS
jgi:polysaccharide deacetylase 2 family uncharacterized protein YibQ